MPYFFSPFTFILMLLLMMLLLLLTMLFMKTMLIAIRNKRLFMNIRMVVNFKDRMLFGSIYIGVLFFFYSNAYKFK